MWYWCQHCRMSLLVFAGLHSHACKTWLVKIIDQRSLAGLCLAQHTPVTFFLQGNSSSHRVKTITAISNKTTFTFSAVWNFCLKAFGYFIWCKTHSDGRCLLVLGKTVIDRSYLSMVQLGTVNAALTTNRRLENFLTRVSLKYVLDGCHVLSLFLPNVRFKTVALSLSVSLSVPF